MATHPALPHVYPPPPVLPAPQSAVFPRAPLSPVLPQGSAVDLLGSMAQQYSQQHMIRHLNQQNLNQHFSPHFSPHLNHQLYQQHVHQIMMEQQLMERMNEHHMINAGYPFMPPPHESYLPIPPPPPPPGYLHPLTSPPVLDNAHNDAGLKRKIAHHDVIPHKKPRTNFHSVADLAGASVGREEGGPDQGKASFSTFIKRGTSPTQEKGDEKSAEVVEKKILEPVNRQGPPSEQTARSDVVRDQKSPHNVQSMIEKRVEPASHDSTPPRGRKSSAGKTCKTNRPAADAVSTAGKCKTGNRTKCSSTNVSDSVLKAADDAMKTEEKTAEGVEKSAVTPAKESKSSTLAKESKTSTPAKKSTVLTPAKKESTPGKESSASIPAKDLKSTSSTEKSRVPTPQSKESKASVITTGSRVVSPACSTGSRDSDTPSSVHSTESIGHDQVNKKGEEKLSGKSRRVFQAPQIALLERIFSQCQYPEPTFLEKLARDLGTTDGKIRVWFQNKRARWRKRSHDTDQTKQSPWLPGTPLYNGQVSSVAMQPNVAMPTLPVAMNNRMLYLGLP